MSVCNHTSWLSLHNEVQNVVLRWSDQLTNIAAALDAPAQKWPTPALLLGHRGYTSILDNVLCRDGKRSLRHEGGAVHLYQDAQTAFGDHPVLFAHSNFYRQTTYEPYAAPLLCHTSTWWRWPDLFSLPKLSTPSAAESYIPLLW
jgi:hypothetical protein